MTEEEQVKKKKRTGSTDPFPLLVQYMHRDSDHDGHTKHPDPSLTPHLGHPTVALLPLFQKAVAAHRAVKDGPGRVTQAVIHPKLKRLLQGILGA